jgi:hypothetical protein
MSEKDRRHHRGKIANIANLDLNRKRRRLERDSFPERRKPK